MPAYRILSLDGGGIRGILTAQLLHRLHEKTGFLDKVDLIAGTSTGGIIAIGLAAGLSTEQIVNLYWNHGAEIFKPRSGTLLGRGFDGTTRAEYSSDPLRRVLEEKIGDVLLKDLQKSVLIPTFDLDDENENRAQRTWKAKFFHNIPGEDSDGEESAVSVTLRTSAAPTYFPACDGYVDGGVAANNPSMASIALALDHRGENPRTVNDIRMLSLGTGANRSFISSPKNPDWGLVNWAPLLVDLFMDASMGVADFQSKQLLRDRYFRYAPPMPGSKRIAMDDADSIEVLYNYAETLVNTDQFKEMVQFVENKMS